MWFGYSRVSRPVCILSLISSIFLAAGAMEASESKMLSPIVAGNTQFALELYQVLRQQEGNLLFSPYSISSALAMTFAGARGETAAQMANVLHFPEAGETLHTAFTSLANHLHKGQEQGEMTLTIANALWIQQGVSLLNQFLEIQRQHYDAELFQVNFQQTTEDARRKINTWVAQQTDQKIKNLLPPGSLNALTRLVLTNAIYFKGNWALQFEQELTRDDVFRLTPDRSITVPMMRRQGFFRYAKHDALQVLSLPYTGENISMVVLLPEEQDGLERLERRVDENTLNAWIEQSVVREVDVFLPKFRFTSQRALSDALRKLGMVAAFSDDADFSGIEPQKTLSITDVIHKAYIDVNEEGTEAAAATAVIIGVTSIMEPEPIPIFKADHPFLFFIRDNQTGSLLFLGRMVNPAQ